MNNFYPTYKSKLKPWIKFWILKGNKIAPKVLSEVIEGTTPITIEGVYKGTSLQDLIFKGQTVQEGTPSPETPIPVQVVKGNNTIKLNDTDYQVNLQDYELCKIGNYQDRIYKENDKWYIEKKIGKVLITPNLISSFQNVKTISKEARVTKISIDCLQGNVTRYFCDTFNYMTNTWNIDEIGIFANSGNNNDQIAFRIPVDSDKNFFNDYPTTLYYQLAEPTTTEITETNLLSQLEAIYNAKLQSGTNEITQLPSDLPFILNFKYYMKG